MLLTEKKEVFNARKDSAFPDHRGRGGGGGVLALWRFEMIKITTCVYAP